MSDWMTGEERYRDMRVNRDHWCEVADRLAAENAGLVAERDAAVARAERAEHLIELMHPMTDEEAQAAYDQAPAATITPERIEEMVRYATSRSTPDRPDLEAAAARIVDAVCLPWYDASTPDNDAIRTRYRELAGGASFVEAIRQARIEWLVPVLAAISGAPVRPATIVLDTDEDRVHFFAEKVDAYTWIDEQPRDQPRYDETPRYLACDVIVWHGASPGIAGGPARPAAIDDTIRLDWIEANRIDVMWSEEMGWGAISSSWASDVFPTVRDAIDQGIGDYADRSGESEGRR